jgi:hypothetical protein
MRSFSPVRRIEVRAHIESASMQMESQGVQLVERAMSVDLQFNCTAATVFWDELILSRLQLADRQCSKQFLEELV